MKGQPWGDQDSRTDLSGRPELHLIALPHEQIPRRFLSAPTYGAGLSTNHSISLHFPSQNIHATHAGHRALDTVVDVSFVMMCPSTRCQIRIFRPNHRALEDWVSSNGK